MDMNKSETSDTSKTFENAQMMVWNNYQLLAQQRMIHINLFIVFMGGISTAFATQIGESLRGNIIACFLSIVEIFLCFIFYKFDLRNRSLIKNTERVIIQMEERFPEDMPRLFTDEEKSTKEVRKMDEGRCYFCRELSASQLYRWLFRGFGVMGVAALGLSIILIWIEK